MNIIALGVRPYRGFSSQPVQAASALRFGENESNKTPLLGYHVIVLERDRQWKSIIEKAFIAKGATVHLIQFRTDSHGKKTKESKTRTARAITTQIEKLYKNTIPLEQHGRVLVIGRLGNTGVGVGETFTTGMLAKFNAESAYNTTNPTERQDYLNRAKQHVEPLREKNKANKKGPILEVVQALRKQGLDFGKRYILFTNVPVDSEHPLRIALNALPNIPAKDQLYTNLVEKTGNPDKDLTVLIDKAIDLVTQHP